MCSAKARIVTHIPYSRKASFNYSTPPFGTDDIETLSTALNKEPIPPLIFPARELEMATQVRAEAFFSLWGTPQSALARSESLQLTASNRDFQHRTASALAPPL